jgi:hypothetical protein
VSFQNKVVGSVSLGIFMAEYVAPTVADIRDMTGADLRVTLTDPHADPHPGLSYGGGGDHSDARNPAYVLRLGDWTSVPLDRYAVVHTLSLMTSVAHLAHARGRAGLVEARGSG